MSTPGLENGTPNGPAELHGEPAGRWGLPAWRKLEDHADSMREMTLRELFDADPQRAGTFAFEGPGM